MSALVHPRRLKAAMHLIAAEPAHSWTVAALAAASGLASRTLQNHFRRFVGRTPLQYITDLRFERARQALLDHASDARVTEIAARCGFAHLGRFALGYRERYGETPSATLKHSRIVSTARARHVQLLSSAFERPAIAVLPFEAIGPGALSVAAMPEEIAAALLRLHWLAVTAPSHARYHLRGKVRGDESGRLRVSAVLVDSGKGRILWADHWDGERDEAFEFDERVAAWIARALDPALRHAEIDRATHLDPERRTAWDLTIAALPGVLSYDAGSEARALERLERAMELAPHDPLPLSLAAWCHGVRACLHFTDRPSQARATARTLAARAAVLNHGDALTEIALAAGYTLAHDLTTATVHAERALTLDGGSAWAWSRNGWIDAFLGNGSRAIERFKLARAIAPADPLSAMCCFGIAAPYMQADRHREAIPWIKRGIAECPPTAAWMNPFLAAAYALENRKDEAKRSLAAWKRSHANMTIAQIRSGLPFGAPLFDRIAEGLESAGLRSPA